MTVVEYYRPGSLDEALARLNQKDLVCIPLGGGTGLNRFGKMELGVVDLQLLGLNEISQEGASVQVGAAATLQALLDSPVIPLALKQAIELERRARMCCGNS